jgi:integrase
MENFDFQTLNNLTKSGRYTDPKQIGLHLWVKTPKRKYWILRTVIDGKQRNLGLGSFPDVKITEARDKAQEYKKSINNGKNPIEDKKAIRKASAKKVSTFREFANECVELKRVEWTNPKHAEQWTYTLEEYAYPIIGNKKLDDIDTDDILKILLPIWSTKTETASRLRGRLEWILASATTRKLRTGINPALWRGHLQTILPAPNKTKRVKHHKALPYRAIPDFMKLLRESDGLGALALEFLILNASRSGEVLYGKRNEIDGDIWTIPANRMKAKKEHQVPLCSRSLEILAIAKSNDAESEYLFSKNSKPLSIMAMPMLLRRLGKDITVHGFRSSFRDWVAEETNYSHEVAEMSLAHTIRNKVESAYRRGNLRERRRELLQDWQNYCLSDRENNVLELKVA